MFLVEHQPQTIFTHTVQYMLAFSIVYKVIRHSKTQTLKTQNENIMI